MLITALILSIISRLTLSSNISLELHLYEDAEENKLLCNDGSPAGYYLRPAPEDAEDIARNRWIFYLEGGGWCWNVTQCLIRALYNGRELYVNISKMCSLQVTAGWHPQTTGHQCKHSVMEYSA